MHVASGTLGHGGQSSRLFLCLFAITICSMRAQCQGSTEEIKFPGEAAGMEKT